jgi:hypothetical protein
LRSPIRNFRWPPSHRRTRRDLLVQRSTRVMRMWTEYQAAAGPLYHLPVSNIALATTIRADRIWAIARQPRSAKSSPGTWLTAAR